MKPTPSPAVLVLLLAAASLSSARASTVYNFVPANGSWGSPSNWSTGTVPNDTDDSNVTIGSGHTANVDDGSFSAGYLYIGSSGVLTLSGTGNGLTLGNTVSSSGGSLQLSGNGGQVFVSGGATLSGEGRLVGGDGAAPAAVTHPRFELTNAAASFDSLQFAGTNSNIQAELILDEGAALTLNGITTGGLYGTLIFNGGETGFGQLGINAFDAGKMANLQINPGSYTGTGTYTLVDATTWTGDFSTITFNGAAYTFGTDLDIDGKTWNIGRSGTDLVLTVVPEPGMPECLAAGAGILLIMKRRRVLA